MWLMEFLPADIRNLRVMTYGYNSQLLKGPVNMGMVDYSNGFIQLLHAARSSEQVPLISVSYQIHYLGREKVILYILLS